MNFLYLKEQTGLQFDIRFNLDGRMEYRSNRQTEHPWRSIEPEAFFQRRARDLRENEEGMIRLEALERDYRNRESMIEGNVLRTDNMNVISYGGVDELRTDSNPEGRISAVDVGPMGPCQPVMLRSNEDWMAIHKDPLMTWEQIKEAVHKADGDPNRVTEVCTSAWRRDEEKDQAQRQEINENFPNVESVRDWPQNTTWNFRFEDGGFGEPIHDFGPGENDDGFQEPGDENAFGPPDRSGGESDSEWTRSETTQPPPNETGVSEQDFGEADGI